MNTGMSTVKEVRNNYKKVLSLFNSNIIELILSYKHIIAETECDWCCDDNCKELELGEEHWEPFKLLCGNEYEHNSNLTKDQFEDKYCDKWYDLSEFAKNECENCTISLLNELPNVVKDNINWNNVWETLSCDYKVYENHVFRYL